jgi:hypothetical protein
MGDWIVGWLFGLIIGCAFMFTVTDGVKNDASRLAQTLRDVEARCASVGGADYIVDTGPKYGCKDGSTGQLPAKK